MLRRDIGAAENRKRGDAGLREIRLVLGEWLAGAGDGPLRRPSPRRLDAGTHAEVDALDRVLGGIGVQAPVKRVKARAEPVEIPGPGHLELVVLADVPDVDAAPHIDGLRSVPFRE